MPGIASGSSLGAVKMRLRVLASACGHRRQLSDLARTTSPALRRILQERPASALGLLVWPYLCASWDVSERLARLSRHYQIIDLLGPPFPFSVTERLVLLDLSDIHPGLRIVMDQPQWFIREGGLTLNLFVEDFRAYSLAFSLGDHPADGIDCLIGSIQGRNTDEALALYRDLTKAAHGMRPRDLLIEICRILCRHWQVRRLLGVRDSQRHHRHGFFGGKTIAPQDYDAIWQDRGGAVEDECFYRLPLAPDRRNEDEVKPNKRSLYRRRYGFLDRLEAEIPERLAETRPVVFADR
ncbi:VirK/YbjX family protein [Paracoccus fontiphilus]|uniref:VirK/YbjX family protein n=1 Tax=Paracoccus fontiphilus TaxID=1815556 RepID=A0ABV7IG65_9RHOB|nr:DUF535 family protein [Paracoccus fontiphilus]